ncbi:MAG: MBL fold metallo-hydrolase [Clostridia bacterium]|nr:MBL fold metallo-hydrolase [Clostridia bacterium]
MRVCNLSSGSDGNLTYIESKNAKVILDAGLSAKEIEFRLSLLKVSPKDLDAILITHEHIDHIKGVDVIATRYNIPVYVHNKGYNALYNKLKRAEQIKFVRFDDMDFSINDLKISNFAVPHDSVYCCGYTFKENEKKLSILTDLGHTTSEVLSKIKGSTLVYLEANHDEDMLKANPNYSFVLKQRILGKNGHLSNISAAQVIKYLAENGTKQVMLSHLSRENNTPSVAYKTICDYLKEYGII